MKKIILTMVFASLFLLNYAQVNKSVQPAATDLFSKAKKQKTAAWICLGGGIALFATGIIIDAVYLPVTIISSIDNGPQPLPLGGQILAITGAAGITASIPLFISASKNKRNARLMLTNQKTAFGLPRTITRNITGLTLAISL